MTEADSSESAGSEKLVDDYEFLDFNNGGLFVQVRFTDVELLYFETETSNDVFFSLCHCLVAIYHNCLVEVRSS